MPSVFQNCERNKYFVQKNGVKFRPINKQRDFKPHKWPLSGANKN